MSAEQFDKELMEIGRWYSTEMRDRILLLNKEYENKIEDIHERYPNVPTHLKMASLKRMAKLIDEAGHAIRSEIDND